MNPTKKSHPLFMITKIMLVSVSIYMITLTSYSFAKTENLKDFNLIPVAEDKAWSDKVKDLGDPNKTKDFWQEYNKAGDVYDKSGKEGGDLGASFSSGIFTRNTLLLFVIRITKWVANVALVAGAACIIYAGYIYAASVFAGDNTSKANDAIKYAAIGIAVITCSYGVMRIVIGAFL